MRKILNLLLLVLPVALSAQSPAQLPPAGQQGTEDWLQYVHPIIGTQRMGHTYPGATSPFGMVQLSPDTDTIPYEQNGKYNPPSLWERMCVNQRVTKVNNMQVTQ